MATVKNKKKMKKNWIEGFHNFWKRHWFWYTIILAVPTIWLSVVLPFLGKKLKLLNATGEFTSVGIWITVCVCGIVVVISYINNN